ncbi:cyclodeaminase/cyclohydrolase family protein [Pseudarthrobacter enclensis]|jgi:formiminotetrahydrofolate cyclodeaminase|uniref:cyclodeaminase/cyclohydrolase family protein n=1 Tax=Pseudarthrobacter enclensis TaxID=993070 RepID=UPI0008160FE7|nr:cyclodeaminase/cyclohydrolase family protein [Pseudarthrobacter enclensis]SCC02138.1 Formiminotetrahydrofolate cyclodeaminase [Pseudarthrobacter enclensis]
MAEQQANSAAPAGAGSAATDSIGTETIGSYLARLASRQPTPGGGAAAALHAAQGAALVAMVARYTTGPKYAEHEALVERTTKVADELSSEALRLADSDEQVFQAVIDAYRLPSDTGELKAAKTSAIQAALVQAAQTPAQLVKLAGAVVDLADGLADVANPNVISDVAAAADAARAAATTARVNIDINVVAIKDQAVRSLLKEQTDGIEEKVVAAADALVARVRERILQ